MIVTSGRTCISAVSGVLAVTGNTSGLARNAFTVRGTVTVLVPNLLNYSLDHAKVPRFKFRDERTTGRPVAFGRKLHTNVSLAYF